MNAWLPFVVMAGMFVLLLLERRFLPTTASAVLDVVAFAVVLTWGVLVPADRQLMIFISLLIAANVAEQRWGRRLTR